MPGGSPWADPTTPTQPGAPYLGPPPTEPPAPQYGPPVQYGYPFAHPGYRYPGPWGPLPPRRPQRPGQVITSAVLAFVQSAIVVIASLYLWFFASLIDLAAQGNPTIYGSSRAQTLSSEGTVLAVVQLASAVLLVVAGIRALSARSHGAWLLTVGAHAVQIVLAVYWAIRLTTLMNDLPGGSGGQGAFVAFAIVFAAAPVVGLAMVVVGAGRHWFESPQRP